MWYEVEMDKFFKLVWLFILIVQVFKIRDIIKTIKYYKLNKTDIIIVIVRLFIILISVYFIFAK